MKTTFHCRAVMNGLLFLMILIKLQQVKVFRGRYLAAPSRECRENFLLVRYRKSQLKYQ